MVAKWVLVLNYVMCQIELNVVTEKKEISTFYFHTCFERNLQIEQSSIMFFTFLLEQLDQHLLKLLEIGTILRSHPSSINKTTRSRRIAKAVLFSKVLVASIPIY